MPPLPPVLVERCISTSSPRVSVWPAATSSVRLRVRVALPVRLAEAARRVVPLPAMVPPVQSKPEAMVSVPAPSSVPAT